LEIKLKERKRGYDPEKKRTKKKILTSRNDHTKFNKKSQGAAQ